MALVFPNPSRNYDDQHKRIQFTGYDGMFRVMFTVTVDALTKSKPSGLDAERVFLAAFDAARPIIEKVAKKAYGRGKRSSFELTAADL